MELRKMLKSSLSGVSRSRCFAHLSVILFQHSYVLMVLFTKVDKSISAMYKKLQKNLNSEELLPSLWDKCKVSCIHFKNNIAFNSFTVQ